MKMQFADVNSGGIAGRVRDTVKQMAPWTKVGFYPTQPQVAIWADTDNDRLSLHKDIRSLPIGGLERGMKETGVLPIETDISDFKPPHMISQPKQKKKLPTRKRVGAKKKLVALKSGYPTMQNLMKDNSMVVSAPTSRSLNTRIGPPQQKHLPNGDVIISHSEMVRDINGSVGFAVTAIPLNPGLAGTFNWLNGIATRYESYRFQKLCISYETQAPTTIGGVVVLAVDYDARDSLPTTKVQVMSWRGTVRASPWTACQHMSIPEDLNKHKSYFVRSGAPAPNEDLSLYDTGTLSVITQGMAAATAVGEIWIHYSVRLMTPKSNSAGGGTAVWGEWDISDNTTTTLLGGNLPATLVQTPGTPDLHVWTFNQPWQGIMGVDVQGTGITLGAAQVTGTAQVVGAGQFQNNAGATAGAGYTKINALQGQTISVSLTNTTITGGGMVFGQALGATS